VSSHQLERFTAILATEKKLKERLQRRNNLQFNYTLWKLLLLQNTLEYHHRRLGW